MRVRSQRAEAGRRCDGDATQAHVDTVDLGGDGHLGEEDAISGQPAQSPVAAIAALDVSNHIEDLLAFRLTSHSTDVQDGRHVLLPEGKRIKAAVTVLMLKSHCDSLIQLSAGWSPAHCQSKHGHEEDGEAPGKHASERSKPRPSKFNSNILLAEAAAPGAKLPLATAR